MRTLVRSLGRKRVCAWVSRISSTSLLRRWTCVARRHGGLRVRYSTGLRVTWCKLIVVGWTRHALTLGDVIGVVLARLGVRRHAMGCLGISRLRITLLGGSADHSGRVGRLLLSVSLRCKTRRPRSGRVSLGIRRNAIRPRTECRLVSNRCRRVLLHIIA